MSELKPLNCSGSSDEEIGVWMSNLQEARFHFGNMWWASVEAFYIALRTLDAEERKQLAELCGPKAKHRGRKLRRRGLVLSEFQGKTFELGGDIHHSLVKEAIRAKLLHHPDRCAQFVATRPRPIVHDTGFPESRLTQLPGHVFSRLLMELREEMCAAQGKAPDGTTMK